MPRFNRNDQHSADRALRVKAQLALREERRRRKATVATLPMRPDGNGSVAFGYGRVSTDKQDISIEAQADQVQGYYAFKLKPQGLTWGGWYLDPETSGVVEFAHRAAGGVLLPRLQKGDHVVFSKLDRAFRDMTDGLVTIRHLQRLGVAIHFLDMNADCSERWGKMMLALYLMFAEMERDRISERTKMAKAHQRKTGKSLAGFCGRIGGRPPIGMRVSKPGGKKELREFLWHERELRLLGLIGDLREQNGWTWEFLALTLNESNLFKPRGDPRWTAQSVSEAMQKYQTFVASGELPEYAKPGKSSFTLTKPGTRFFVMLSPETSEQPNCSTSAPSATEQPSSPCEQSSVNPRSSSNCEPPDTKAATASEATVAPTLGQETTSSATPTDTKPTATT